MPDFIDPTIMTQEEWQIYLQKAMAALHIDHTDKEALQAIQDANNALAAYDEAAAASPSERIGAGLEGGLRGLGHAAADIPRGLSQFAAHPIEAIINTPKALMSMGKGLVSDNPEEIGRAVGNIGTLMAPSAKLSTKVGLTGAIPAALSRVPGVGAALKAAQIGEIAAPTLGKATATVVSKPFKAVGTLLDRPGLRNQLLKEQIRGQQLANESPVRETNPLVQENVALRNENLRLRNEAMSRNAPEVTEQTGLKTEKLRQAVGRQPKGPETGKVAKVQAPEPPTARLTKGHDIQSNLAKKRGGQQPSAPSIKPKGPKITPKVTHVGETGAKGVDVEGPLNAKVPKAVKIPTKLEKAAGITSEMLADEDRIYDKITKNGPASATPAERALIDRIRKVHLNDPFEWEKEIAQYEGRE